MPTRNEAAIIRQTTPGMLPPFIVSLLPEGWLESVLNDRDERAMLRSGKRYLSNMGRETGFAVPATALVALPDGMPPALLVERFDIRDSASDNRLLAMEDLCSVLDLPPDAKYDGTIERVARALRALSTEPEEDVLTILKRVLFAWLIADGDRHRLLRDDAAASNERYPFAALTRSKLLGLGRRAAQRLSAHLHHSRLEAGTFQGCI